LTVPSESDSLETVDSATLFLSVKSFCHLNAKLPKVQRAPNLWRHGGLWVPLTSKTSKKGFPLESLLIYIPNSCIKIDDISENAKPIARWGRKATGLREVLTKPVSMNQLAATVRKLLDEAG
jgi:hypothetical protein